MIRVVAEAKKKVMQDEEEIRLKRNLDPGHAKKMSSEYAELNMEKFENSENKLIPVSSARLVLPKIKVPQKSFSKDRKPIFGYKFLNSSLNESKVSSNK